MRDAATNLLLARVLLLGAALWLVGTFGPWAMGWEE